MTDLLVTTTGVVAANAATGKASGISGAAIIIGQSLFLDPADGKIKPAKADSGSPMHAPNIVGVALDSAPGANQPINYAPSGDLTLPTSGGGTTMVVGQVYVVSPTNAGGIAPYSDLTTTGMFVAFLGVAINATTLRLGLIPASVQKP